MWKLTFFVVAPRWVNGGYVNTHYFKTKEEAMQYQKEKGLKLIELKKVTYNEFQDDYLGF